MSGRKRPQQMSDTATKRTKKPKTSNKDGMNTMGNIWEHRLSNEEFIKFWTRHLKEGLISEN
jgi:hypothetical protein